MKKLLSLALTILIVFAVIPIGAITVSAEISGTTGDCTWKLDGTVLTISGNGEMGYYNYQDSSPWGTSITEVIIEDGVTSIGNRAFYDCYNLTSITIPDSVTSIGNMAFYDCYNLTSVTIPDSVISIGQYAFYDCRRLTSITIPDSVSSIGYEAFDYTAFYNDDSNWENDVLYIANHLIRANNEINGTYIIKSGTKSICEYAFGGCEKITSITIPDSVVNLGLSAFAFCNNLKSVSIGSGVSSIDGDTFYYSKSLTEITVSKDNRYFCDVDGVFFNKDRTELIAYPVGRNDDFYAIPNGVTRLSCYAFASNNLTSISVPKSLVEVWGCAFIDSFTLNTVYYCGTEQEWNNIVITDVGNGYFCDANRYYHNYSNEFTIDKIVNDFEDGSKSRHCMYCDAVTDVAIIPKTSLISGVCGNNALWAVTYDGTLKIGGAGATYGYKVDSATPWYDYSSQITKIEIADTITTIGSFNFYSLDNVETVYINNPDTVFEKRTFKTDVRFVIYSKGGSTVEEYAKMNNITIIKPENPHMPLAPVLLYCSGNSVTLKAVDGYEYSIDGINWQTSTVFENLESGTSYNFYQRIADGVYAPSKASTALTVITLTEPNAPTVESVVGQVVTLKKLDGYEYSADGEIWQKSNVFLSVAFDKELCFYQRIGGNGSNLASPASNAVKIIIVSAPKVLVGFDTLRIVETDGYEYSYDGKTWRDSGFFEVLDGEYYTLYHRPKNSEGTIVYAQSGTTVFTNGRNTIKNPTADDLVWIKKQLLFDVQNNLGADVNSDGVVNVLDYIALQKNMV